MQELKFYINFNAETGDIKKFTNQFDDSSPSIEVDKETYVKFIKGELSGRDYAVRPGTSGEFKYELVAKHKDLLEFDVDKSIHNIQKSDTVDFDNGFVIRQNITDATWTVSLTPDLKDFLTKTTYYKEKIQHLFVTAEDDPNILLESINIPLWTILYDNDYVVEDCNKEVAIRKDISVYCGKAFENYVHIQEK